MSDKVVSSSVRADWMSSDLARLTENDGIILEMANLKSTITDLPPNIILWTRPQPEGLPHNKYRIKVTKDHKHSISYSISANPVEIERYNVGKKYNLDAYEKKEIVKFIQHFYPLLISYVDSRIDADELEIQIQKINQGK